MPSKRVHTVAVHRRIGGVRQLFLIPGKGFSYKRGERGRARMTAAEVDQAKKWARRRRAKGVRVTGPLHKWLFLDRAAGVVWPTNRRLLRALNATGRRRRRVIRIISGMRTPYQAWQLRMAYLQGRGNTAARCCSRYSGQHSWSACGKDPWSNHADGNAADCGTINGATGNYTSLASDGKARRIFEKLGGCFPVTNPWEPWHAEMRNR